MQTLKGNVYYICAIMIPNQVSVIILGNWNPRIFRPFWIKTQLFGLPPENEIQGLVNFDELDFAFEHNGITLFPKYNSLEIQIIEYSQEKGLIVGELVKKILELLPQTPIKALGVNIKYNFTNEISNIVLEQLRSVNLKIKNLEVNQLKYSSVKELYVVNMICELSPSIININFNFHYPRIIEFTKEFINDHVSETKIIFENGK